MALLMFWRPSYSILIHLCVSWVLGWKIAKYVFTPQKFWIVRWKQFCFPLVNISRIYKWTRSGISVGWDGVKSEITVTTFLTQQVTVWQGADNLKIQQLETLTLADVYEETYLVASVIRKSKCHTISSSAGYHYLSTYSVIMWERTCLTYMY